MLHKAPRPKCCNFDVLFSQLCGRICSQSPAGVTGATRQEPPSQCSPQRGYLFTVTGSYQRCGRAPATSAKGELQQLAGARCNVLLRAPATCWSSQCYCELQQLAGARCNVPSRASSNSPELAATCCYLLHASAARFHTRSRASAKDAPRPAFTHAHTMHAGTCPEALSAWTGSGG